MTERQPDAPAVPGVTRWRRKLAEPFEVEAVELVEDLDWEALARWCGGRIETYACGDSGEYESHMVVPAERGEVSAFEGDFLVRRPDGKFEVRDFDRGWFAATFEPAPEPLTASQCDRLRRMATEDGNAVEAVKRVCDLAVTLGGAYPEVAETVAAAREALRVLSGEKAGAEPAASSTDAAEGPWAESPGVALIAVERSRQVTAEGYTPGHDAEHDGGELAEAAAAYALAANGDGACREFWPFRPVAFKPVSPVRALTKAGALIAAELDRLVAKGANHG
jgi:hypothetical protein